MTGVLIAAAVVVVGLTSVWVAGVVGLVVVIMGGLLVTIRVDPSNLSGKRPRTHGRHP